LKEKELVMVEDYNKSLRVADKDALLKTLMTVEAGDTVKATFYDKTYRTFEIIGIVKVPPYDDNQLLVASWFLNTPRSRKPKVEEALDEEALDEEALDEEALDEEALDEEAPDEITDPYVLRGKPTARLKALEILDTKERALF
jgi:hypothetical protein